jgi:fermentation-respiration switch protein FrsA (DUF1100 family)
MAVAGYDCLFRMIEADGSGEHNPTFWNNISPQNFYDQVAAPVLTHHGTADASVPFEWSNTLAAGLKPKSHPATDLYLFRAAT